VTITSAQLLDAAQQLRAVAGICETGAERHDAFGRSLGGAMGDVSHVWGSPEADRFLQEGLGLATLAGQVPAGLHAAAAALRVLASTAASLASELEFHERALATAEATASEVVRSRWLADPEDAARLRTLDQRASEAAATAARARDGIAAAAAGWTSACRGALSGVQQAGHQIGALLLGPGHGPGPQGTTAPGGGPMPSTPDARQLAGWAWEYGASPAIVAFHERGRAQILHLAPREPRPVTVRAYEMAVVRRGHWRQPPTLRSPNSPLHGTVRRPHWVSPVYGPARSVERVVPVEPPRMRGVAVRVELPREHLSRGTRVLGVVGGVAAVGEVGYREWSEVTQNEQLTGTNQVAHVTSAVAFEGGGAVGGGAVGAKGGAVAGAAIGTAIAPGVGTAVGAVAGAVVVGAAGSRAGQWVGGKLNDGLKRLNPAGIFG
jgi:hypothetical protein